MTASDLLRFAKVLMDGGRFRGQQVVAPEAVTEAIFGMTGQIAGMAGAYGNVGAVIYLVLFSLVDSKTFFFVLATGAALSFIVTFFMLEEPKDSFVEEFVHDAEGKLEA